MPTDDDRREVARRLREVQSDVIPGTKTEVHPIAGRIIGVACGYDLPDFQGLLGRLADLIEPSEPKVRCVAEVKVDGERLEKLVHDAVVELTGIDRDALLVEVKELEKCAYYFGLDFDEDEPLRDRLEEASEAFAGSAHRIREALGVSDG